MPPISQPKKDKISEQILHYLFTSSPEAKFTSDIAGEIARDEEFTLSLLDSLKTKKLVLQVTKSITGKEYSKRKRWSLSPGAYSVYKNSQHFI